MLVLLKNSLFSLCSQPTQHVPESANCISLSHTEVCQIRRTRWELVSSSQFPLGEYFLMDSVTVCLDKVVLGMYWICISTNNLNGLLFKGRCSLFEQFWQPVSPTTHKQCVGITDSCNTHLRLFLWWACLPAGIVPELILDTSVFLCRLVPAGRLMPANVYHDDFSLSKKKRKHKYQEIVFFICW